ncbi:LacI family DNA-binding transcriptional regulator [Streptococcaceae bacterium ESL0687]|nr:LacI family DNA-binding transcriptional regulator [Streptococcaceae bacterium ESL0687]
MKPKLEDVARLANVSKTTVSRVLNKRGYLSEETIEKVYQAMQELNYQPNIVARQLHKQRTDIIGLLFPVVSNPFFGELIEELEKKLYQKGYKVLVGNSLNDSDKESDYLNQLLTRQVDGLIVGTHNTGIKEYKYNNLPIVAIERTLSDDIPVVECDNYAGGVLATNYLYDQGARYIIHTTGKSILDMPSDLRHLAYKDTMIDLGLPPRAYSVYFELDIEEKKKVIKDMLDENPQVDGIFAGNDVEAAMIIDIARKGGKRVPEDLKVIGFDGTKISRILQPNLPTIIQPIEEMAEKAIELLEKRIQGEEVEKEVILPISLYLG